MKICSVLLPLVLLLSPAHGAEETAPARTGQGAGVYETVPGWPNYPEGKSLGNLHGDLASDSKGNVYIATGNTIQVIGSDPYFAKFRIRIRIFKWVESGSVFQQSRIRSLQQN